MHGHFSSLSIINFKQVNLEMRVELRLELRVEFSADIFK